MSTRVIALCLSFALTPVLAAAQVAAVAPEPPVAAVAPVAAAAPAVAAVATLPGPANATPVALAATLGQASTPQPAPAPQPAAPSQPRDRAERSTERLRMEVEQAHAEAERRRGNEQSKGVNVRIDATVIESHGDQVTGRKMLTLTLVDGEWGSVRSSQRVYNKMKTGAGYYPSPLNMDARAFLRDDGRIKVALTLEYRGLPADQGAASDQQPEAVNVVGPVDDGIKQNVTVVLEPGKPLIVAQSSDAVGDRRVALELKATVLK